MSGSRHKARAVALQALYEVDSTGHRPDETLDRLMQEEALEEGSDFARELVRGVLEHKSRLDDVIARFAPAFPVDQLAVIDRNILRLAIFEVLLDNKVPVKAAINEAVDLAKRFGSNTSPKFINGVLGSVAAEISSRRSSTSANGF